jgi:hypothetical protein
MAELIVEGPELVVRLSWLEKLAARLVGSVSDAESTAAAIRSAAGI